LKKINFLREEENDFTNPDGRRYAPPSAHRTSPFPLEGIGSEPDGWLVKLLAIALFFLWIFFSGRWD